MKRCVGVDEDLCRGLHTLGDEESAVHEDGLDVIGAARRYTEVEERGVL
jgi:hypothetical protein